VAREPRIDGDLDEFLSRAVDRQVAEQRALREALNDLRAAVETLATRQPDEAPAIDRTMHAEVAAMRRELAELCAIVATSQPAPVVNAPDVDMTPVRDELTTVNANIDGIAQALIDLNSGLRDWAAGVDEGLTTLARSVNAVKKIADDARTAATAANESLALEVADKNDDELDSLVDDKLEQVEARIEETGQLAINIRDRLDEFERIAGAMRAIPKTVEGTVAQALKRAMAARAKLDREAEAAMDETLAAVDEQLEALHEAVGSLQTSDDGVRKVALGQIELTNRMEAMQEALLERIEESDVATKQVQDTLTRILNRNAAAKKAKPPPRKPATRKRTTSRPQDGEK